MALLSRKPDLTIAKLSRMVGRAPSHPLVQQLINEQYFPYSFVKDNSTGHVALRVGSDLFAPEELMAMLLQHAKDMSAAHTGGKLIKDCVLSIPSGFTSHERRALVAAAGIANLNVLSLIEENTAAALHFGMDRSADEAPKTLLLYNMGAGGVQATIVRYSSFVAKDVGKNKTFSQFEVLGKAWDFSSGSFAMDLKLADLLARRFNENWKKRPAGEDVRKHQKPMIRLRQEAVKIREVLSANAEIPVRIEQLHGNADLHTKVTRVELESEIASVLEGATEPITRALAIAHLSSSDIDGVELLGGGVRVPAVKRLLETYFSGTSCEIGQHMNGDEAMALGASFHGANLSTAFIVRKVGMSDIASFGVSVSLESLPSSSEPQGVLDTVMSNLFGSSPEKTAESGEEEKWNKHVSIYPAGSAVPSKVKTVAFQHDTDLICRVQYDSPNELPPGTNPLITVYNISGVAGFTKESKLKPKIQLSFVLDESGLVSLVKAEALIDNPSVFMNVTNDDSANSTVAADSSITANNTENNGTAAKKDKKKKLKKNKKEDPSRRVLTVSEVYSAITPPLWSQSDIATSKDKLRQLDIADARRRSREAALNSLEGFIYSTRSALEDITEDESLAAVTLPEQRYDVIDMCNAAEEWLYDEGRSATESDFRDRENLIAAKINTMRRRAKEFADRPKTVQRALTKLAGVVSHVEEWSSKHPHITESEKEQLLGLVAKTESWIKDKTEAQRQLSDTDEPAFLCDEVKTKVKSVISLYDKLSKKAKPAPEVRHTVCVDIVDLFSFRLKKMRPRLQNLLVRIRRRTATMEN